MVHLPLISHKAFVERYQGNLRFTCGWCSHSILGYHKVTMVHLSKTNSCLTFHSNYLNLLLAQCFRFVAESSRKSGGVHESGLRIKVVAIGVNN